MLQLIFLNVMFIFLILEVLKGFHGLYDIYCFCGGFHCPVPLPCGTPGGFPIPCCPCHIPFPYPVFVPFIGKIMIVPFGKRACLSN